MFTLNGLYPYEDNVLDVMARHQLKLAAFGVLQHSTLPTVTTGTTTGSSSATVLIASGANFTAAGIAAGDIIYNTTDGSVAIVKSKDSATQLTCTPLETGSDNTWQTGDSFAIRGVPYQVILLTADDGSNPKGFYQRNSANSAWVLCQADRSCDVQVFTSNGTWTKPTGAKRVKVMMIGGGGGGGSGRVTVSGSAATRGGGGGSAGGILINEWAAGLLGSTESITVGQGGTGGAAVTASATTDGNDGTDGTASSFGSWATTDYGKKGLGATAGTIAGGAGTVDYLYGITSQSASGAGGAGASSGASPGTTPTALQATDRPTGGGGGGAANADGTTRSNGGAGGTRTANPWKGLAGGTAGVVGGAAAGVGQSFGTGDFYSGTGGGGGAGGGSAAAGAAGANGGLYGGGGGGGGGAQDTNDSGKGGDGANGIVVVITYF